MAEEILDAATSRLLMKKTWCHGQVVAAFQGVLHLGAGLGFNFIVSQTNPNPHLGTDGPTPIMAGPP